MLMVKIAFSAAALATIATSTPTNGDSASSARAATPRASRVTALPPATVVDVDARLTERLKPVVPAKFKGMPLRGFRINSVQFVQSRFDLKDDAAVKLPESRFYDVYKNANCTPERRGWTEQLTLTKSVTLTRSVTFTKSVTSGSSRSASITVTLPKVGGSASASSSRSVTVTNSNTWSETEAVTSNSSRMINLEVNPGKALLVRLQKTVYAVRVPFDATVTADAVVEAEYTKMVWRRLPIGIRIAVPVVVKQRFLAADLLKDTDRTFDVAGFVENSSADELEVMYAERGVKAEDKCDEFARGQLERVNSIALAQASAEADAASAPGGGARAAGSAKSNSSPTVTADDKALAAEIVAADEGQTGVLVTDSISADVRFGQAIEEFFGSTRVTTSDSYGNVEVRHLSFGPGFCDVETQSTLGHTVKTLAPPAIWSGWQTVETHAGSISVGLNTIVKCDTGVRSQVRYWK